MRRLVSGLAVLVVGAGVAAGVLGGGDPAGAATAALAEPTLLWEDDLPVDEVTRELTVTDTVAVLEATHTDGRSVLRPYSLFSGDWLWIGLYVPEHDGAPPSFAYGDARLYTALRGTLGAMDLASAEHLWDVDATLAPRSLTAGPNRVHTVSADGHEVTTYRGSTGDRMWSIRTERPAVEVTASSAGTFVNYGCGAVDRVRPLTGEVLWSRTGGCGNRTEDPLVLAGEDRLYANRDAGEVDPGRWVPLDVATGDRLIGSPLPYPPAYDPSVDIRYAVDAAGVLTAHRGTTNRLRWSAHGVDPEAGVRPGGGRVAVRKATAGRLWMLDALSGSELWRMNPGVANPLFEVGSRGDLVVHTRTDRASRIMVYR